MKQFQLESNRCAFHHKVSVLNSRVPSGIASQVALLLKLDCCLLPTLPIFLGQCTPQIYVHVDPRSLYTYMICSSSSKLPARSCSCRVFSSLEEILQFCFSCFEHSQKAVVMRSIRRDRKKLDRPAPDDGPLLLPILPSAVLLPRYLVSC